MREFRMEDLTGLTKEERNWHPDTGEDEAMLGDDDEDMAAMYEAMLEEHKEELAGMDLEDSKGVARAETKMEVAAEHLCIPIRPAGEHITTARAHDVPSDTAINSNLRIQPHSLEAISPPEDEQLSRLSPVAKIVSCPRKEGHQFTQSPCRTPNKDDEIF
jgi:hypothetical protein